MLDQLECQAQVFAVDLHPTQNLLAYGTIDGTVSIYSYSKTQTSVECNLFSSSNPHSSSCRSLCFSKTGSQLHSVSSDMSLQIIDVKTGKRITRKRDAHKSAINVVQSLTEDLICTGDDNGIIKLWDLRAKRQIVEFKHQDYITDFQFSAEKNVLLSSSGDGCLGAWDTRKHKGLGMSGCQDDELLNICIARNSTKVISGTSSGKLNHNLGVILLFSWNQWGDTTDRFPGHPSSVSSVIASKNDDSTLYTASGDGMIRSIHILPNSLVGVIGDCGDNFPIEVMRLGSCGDILVTCSHDESIKFWNTDLMGGSAISKDLAGNSDSSGGDSDILTDKAEPHGQISDSDSDSEEPETALKVKTKKGIQFKQTPSTSNSFFSGLD